MTVIQSLKGDRAFQRLRRGRAGHAKFLSLRWRPVRAEGVRVGSVRTGDNHKLKGERTLPLCLSLKQDGLERLFEPAANAVARHRLADSFADDDPDMHPATARRAPAQT